VNLFVKSLDWFDSLAGDRVRDLIAFMDNVGPDLILGADIVSDVAPVVVQRSSHVLPRAQLYHPDMIAPFLTTLNIALHASKSPAGGIAYLALTVRNIDLFNTFIFTLGGRWPFLVSSIADSFNP
jgi:hypothetical protein